MYWWNSYSDVYLYQYMYSANDDLHCYIYSYSTCCNFVDLSSEFN